MYSVAFDERRPPARNDPATQATGSATAMRTPEYFAETRPELLQGLIRSRPLATVVAHTRRGLDAHHLPLHYDPLPAPYGTLRGHVARTNALCADLLDEAEALAIFNGPNAYISPSWYPTKQQTGKAVPTWDYVVVHARGQLRTIEGRDWLRAHLEALVGQQEAEFPQPWRLADAPGDYIERMLNGIVGIELSISALCGQWKLSQNQPAANRAGVVAGLAQSEQPEAAAIAALIARAATTSQN